jgi:acyl-CoA synthetase (AMP-forming)/AMP-acid ligase II
VVVGDVFPGGERRLVAYLVAAGPCNIAEQELIAFLERHLPGYMVPSVFVTLDSLPLSLNAKVDRSSLPAPEQLQYHAANSPSFTAETQRFSIERGSFVGQYRSRVAI